MYQEESCHLFPTLCTTVFPMIHTVRGKVSRNAGNKYDNPHKYIARMTLTILTKGRKSYAGITAQRDHIMVAVLLTAISPSHPHLYLSSSLYKCRPLLVEGPLVLQPLPVSSYTRDLLAVKVGYW